MNTVKSAGIIVYRMNGGVREYLILRYAHGHWDLPKGKLEAGETVHQAAHRELFEEAGITAQIDQGFEESLSYECTDHDGHIAHKIVTFLLGVANTDAIRLSDEHTDFAWCGYLDACHQLTYENAQQVITKAEQFLMRAHMQTY